MNPFTIEFSAATCGAGKSQWAVETMARVPGRYVYAVDRVEEFAARRKRILDAAPPGAQIEIITLSRADGDAVTRDFPFWIETLAAHPHAILMVTHEATKRVDHTPVERREYTLIVDEDLKLWSSGTIELPVSAPLMASLYDLDPIDDHFAQLTRKADGPSLRDVIADDLARPLTALHDRADRLGVIVNLTSWDDLTDRQRLTWFTVFDLQEFRHYERVVVLANAFTELLTYRLARTLAPTIQWQAIEIGRREEWKPRDLTIRYVAADHTISTTWLKSAEGQIALRAWGDWVRSTVDPTEHYWASNKAFASSLNLPGIGISPKIAGSNAFRSLTQSSIAYAAKASQVEARVFAALTGGAVTADDVRRDREFEDLIQIVFRSSLRVPGDDRPVTVNVYDTEQAEFLAAYFRSSGLPFRVTVEHHDLGIRRTPRTVGRPRGRVSGKAMTQAERAAAYRARKRADRKAA